MLPPIPHSLQPVTAQQDPVKPRPDIQPVTPAQAGAQQGGVGLQQRDPSEVAERLREEQRRRQRQGYSAEQLAAGEVAEEDQALLENLPRQGLWVDVEV
ncbi:aspartate-semialdehyde dehydrogenase [Pseudomonas cavernae]|uniref:Aspartate-semialdehyde dehydrogenase n=1 Tax=Pseudomonas cavernae TaxID=2320867 RepID=A0A385Z750_9PSED|nr:aspartate-semialdehyde dehydrogenase [Pseudomonas cavernae]AYC33803.1 aspartate-semialdehyde dehydrogenase [Pseudomonas cavernae]